MTGYGKSEVQSNEVSLSLELRTINSRFLDFSHRLPKILSSFEDDALKLIKSKCIRGRVTLSVKLDYLESEKNCFVLNQNKLENYMRMVKEIQEKAFVRDSPSIGEILSFPDILNFENENEEIQLKTIFLDALENALVENDYSRILEGKNIQDDLVKHQTSYSSGSYNIFCSCIEVKIHNLLDLSFLSFHIGSCKRNNLFLKFELTFSWSFLKEGTPGKLLNFHFSQLPFLEYVYVEGNKLHLQLVST